MSASQLTWQLFESGRYCMTTMSLFNMLLNFGVNKECMLVTSVAYYVGTTFPFLLLTVINVWSTSPTVKKSVKISQQQWKNHSSLTLMSIKNCRKFGVGLNNELKCHCDFYLSQSLKTIVAQTSLVPLQVPVIVKVPWIHHVACAASLWGICDSVLPKCNLGSLMIHWLKFTVKLNTLEKELHRLKTCFVLKTSIALMLKSM